MKFYGKYMKSISKIVKAACLSLVMAVAGNMSAAIPTGYYNSALKLKTSELKTALYRLINPHQQVSSYNALPDYFKKTDVKPGTSEWWDMYSNMPVNISIQFGTYMNREHSLPKSWWGGSTAIPAYVDLFHLYPAEAVANQKKSNYPLGEISSQTWTNGVSSLGRGVNSGGAAYVFEPADEYKGDFARTYFYMVTCYQDMSWVTTWQVANGAYPSLQQWAIDLLLKWHRNDPVSEKEINRNEAVYKIQNNRNPFIDHPELVEYIWGNKTGQEWNPGTGTDPDKNPIFLAPINGMDIDFGEVAIGKTGTSQVVIKGQDLTTADIRVNIGGYQCKYFNIPGTTQNAQGATALSLSSTQAGSASGQIVTINYTPQEVTDDNDRANMIVQGAGTSGTILVTLRGTAMPVPTLTKPLQPKATEITNDGYIASWTLPAGEVADYYIVKRQIYTGSNVTTKEDMAESEQYVVDDFADADRESFTVRSVRLGYESPESDVVIVNKSASLEGVEADAPMVVETYPGMLVIRCSTPLTGLTVVDVAGRVIKRVTGDINDGYELLLPPGVYLLTAPEHRKPVKAVSI